MKRHTNEYDDNQENSKRIKIEPGMIYSYLQAAQDIFSDRTPIVICHTIADGNCLFHAAFGEPDLSIQGTYKAKNAQKMRQEIYNFLQQCGPIFTMSELRKEKITLIFKNFIFENKSKVAWLQNVNPDTLFEDSNKELCTNLYEKFKERFNKDPDNKLDYISIDELTIIASISNIKIKVFTTDRIVGKRSHIYEPDSEFRGDYLCKEIWGQGEEVAVYLVEEHEHFEHIEYLNHQVEQARQDKIIPVIKHESFNTSQEISIFLNFQIAIQEGKSDQFLDGLAKCEADREKLSIMLNKTSLLSYAAYYSTIEIVKKLYEMGAGSTNNMNAHNLLTIVQRRKQDNEQKFAGKEKDLEYEKEIENCSKIIEFFTSYVSRQMVEDEIVNMEDILIKIVISDSQGISYKIFRPDHLKDQKEEIEQLEAAEFSNKQHNDKCWPHIVQFCLAKSANAPEISKYQQLPYSLKNFYSLMLEHRDLKNHIDEKYNGITLSHIAAYFHSVEIIITLRKYCAADPTVRADKSVTIVDDIFSKILQRYSEKDLADAIEAEGLEEHLLSEIDKRMPQTNYEEKLYHTLSMEKKLAETKGAKEISSGDNSYYQNIQDSQEKSVNVFSDEEKAILMSILQEESLIDIIKQESFAGKIIPEEEKILAIEWSARIGTLNTEERDILDKNNMALHIAVKKNYPKIVKSLLYCKADIEAVNSDNVTPIFLAAELGCTAMVQIFLDCHANLRIVNTTNGNTLLHAASHGGCNELVTKLLALKLFDPNSQNNKGVASLHLTSIRDKR